MRALAVVLALALWPASAGAELRARSRDLGAASPVVGLLAIEQGGSESWGSGIPSPTIDCAAVGTSASASLQCSGATPSFAGPGQVAAGSPWWYRGDASVRPSIALNGSTDWWTLGNVANPAAQNVTVCAMFKHTSATGILFSRDDFGANRQLTLDVESNNVTLNIFGPSATLCAHVIGAASVGSYYSVCAAYEFVANGTSILRGNLNGVASTPRTNCAGPIQDKTVAATVGVATTSYPFAGAIRRVAIWTGPDAPTSAAQLAQLVATQWGLAADKPAGTVATHARTDSTLCCPFSDAECFTVGPGAPCIHAPSYSGWAGTGGGIEVYGTGANAILYSNTFAHASWLKASGVSAADASASCPMGPAGVRMSLVTTDGEADYITQYAAGTPGRSVWMARATGDSACGVTFADSDGDGAQSVPLTDGPVRYWSGGAGHLGLSVARPVGGCVRWCMQYAQGQAGVDPVPYRSTDTGTAYTGAAGTATTLTGTSALLNKDRWALGITSTPTGGWATVSTGLLQWGGNYGAANSVSVYTDAAAKLVVEVYDGASGWRRWTADAAFSGTTPVQKKIGVAFNAGTIRVLVDGAEVTGSTSGAGTGLLAALPSTSLVVGTVGSSILRGLDARVCQANDLAGVKRCLR